MSATPVLTADLCSLVPDPVAQAQWDRVSDAADKLNDAIAGIAWATVSGELTRAELQDAADLMGRAIRILGRTSTREGAAFDELEQVAPAQIWGEVERGPPQ